MRKKSKLEDIIKEQLHIIVNLLYIIANTETNEEYELLLHRMAKDNLNHVITLWKKLKEKNIISDLYDTDLDKNMITIQKLTEKHMRFYRNLYKSAVEKKERELLKRMIDEKDRHLAISRKLLET